MTTLATSPAPLMLSVSGCRGVVGSSMSPEVAARFGLVAGAYFRERFSGTGRPLVVIGRDGRVGGQILAQAAAAGLAGAGCDVLDLGVAMTPTVGVMVDAKAAAGGIVVTASHNPQHWNGLKPMIRENSGLRSTIGAPSASAPPKAFADQLIERYRAAERAGAPSVGYDALGEITPAATGAALDLPSEGAFAHIQKVRDALSAVGIAEDRRWQALRCVVDSVNASGREAARHFLGQTLAHHLGDSPSGVFPHTPEPTRENLQHLCRFVADKGASVGFAQDPDADRLALIDETGAYIGEEYTLALCAQAVLEAEQSAGRSVAGATLCVNLSTSRMIEDVAQRFGARVVRTAVGEANVVEAMKSHGAIFGGEGNGGVIWPRVTYIRDSLSGMGLILGLLARTGRRLSELAAAIPAYAIVKRKADLPDLALAPRAVEAVARAFPGLPHDRQDGIRIEFAQQRAWLHVRGSNTEPIIRLIAEAPSTDIADRILGTAQSAIATG
jgi:phosphomannomutase